MKKVTLLGDSIRFIGYGNRVQQLLKEDFEVFQPNENCRFSKYTLWGVISGWAAGIQGSDVIHWNNGLWDALDQGEGVFSSPEEYVATMLRIAKILKKKSKVVIFATTTPVREEYKYLTNERINQYNKLIVPKLLEMGIIINDLHAVVYPHIQDYIREDDNIHLTEQGIEACANQVAGVIRYSLRNTDNN